MKKTLFYGFVIASLLASCTAGYNITVHADGSATVQTIGVDSVNLVRYSQSPQVSHLDTTEAGITFEISSVDSLGNYLWPLQPGFIQFRIDSSALIITEGNGNAFSESTGRSCCTMYMDIQFDRDIKSVNSANETAEVSDTNSISIARDKSDLRKGKNKLNVAVQFGHTDTIPSYQFGKWGGGLDVGAGTYFLTGASQKSINQGMTYANVGLTISYSRFHFMLQTGGMAGSLKQNLSYGPEWKQGNRFSSTHHQLSFGYELLGTKHFNIIPFVSGGVVKFMTPVGGETNDWVQTKYSPMYAFGTAFDFKMNSPLKKNREPGHEYTMNYVYFRLSTGIYPGYFHEALGIKGSMCFVNLGVGFYAGGRRAK